MRVVQQKPPKGGFTIQTRQAAVTCVLVARSVGIVSAASRPICSGSGSTNGGSTDPYRHSTGYGRTTIATTVNSTAITTVINADASSIIRGGVS